MSIAKLMSVKRTRGRTQVGRCATDSKVGLGLKVAPKIRPTELTDGAASGTGVTGLAMFFSSDGQRVEALVPSSSTLGRCEKLQAGRVYRNSGKLGNVDPADRAINALASFGRKMQSHHAGICGTAAMRDFVYDCF